MNAQDNNQDYQVVFINPSLNYMTQTSILNKRVDKDIPNQETPHIGIAYLMGALKKNGIKYKYIDLGSEHTISDSLFTYVNQLNPTIVALSAFTADIKNAAQIAKEIKSRFHNVYTVVGGPHANAFPLKTLEEFECFDFCFFADGEKSIVQLVKNIKEGKQYEFIPNVVSRYNKKMKIDYPEDLDDLPFPDWESFDLSKYGGSYPHRTKLELPIITGRGCPYKCTFCCRSLGDKIRRRSVSSVISEIEHNIQQYACEAICFIDETFIFHDKWTQEFLSQMIDKGINNKIKWSCSTRVSNMNPDLLKQMKAAGCYYIFFGMESADNDTLKRIKKKIWRMQ